MKTALRIVLKREASRKNSVFGRTAAGHIANCRRYVGVHDWEQNISGCLLSSPMRSMYSTSKATRLSTCLADMVT